MEDRTQKSVFCILSGIKLLMIAVDATTAEVDGMNKKQKASGNNGSVSNQIKVQPSLGVNADSVSNVAPYVLGSGMELPTTEMIINYPNPFKTLTTIEFAVVSNSYISVNVFDMYGRNVSNLLSGYYNRGSYTINFSSRGITAGVYYAVLQTQMGKKVVKIEKIN